MDSAAKLARQLTLALAHIDAQTKIYEFHLRKILGNYDVIGLDVSMGNRQAVQKHEPIGDSPKYAFGLLRIELPSLDESIECKGEVLKYEVSAAVRFEIVVVCDNIAMLHVLVEFIFLFPLVGALSDDLYGNKTVRKYVPCLIDLSGKPASYFLQYLVAFLEDCLAGEVAAYLHSRFYCQFAGIHLIFNFPLLFLLLLKHLLNPVACHHESLFIA